ncbi:MAG: hypothetical protein M3081_02960 [Gemmatimonadota bacterium]|nr:hypothetical protein [Gemmatimonadota bacterium]
MTAKDSAGHVIASPVLEWSTSDATHATVAAGAVRGVARGAASIVARDVRSGVTAQFVVSVPRFPVPLLAQWTAQMTQHAVQHCAEVADTGTATVIKDPPLGATYYDGARVYYQIADYTGQGTFITCARNAAAVYRHYVLYNGGGVPGYWNFPHGQLMDFERRGDTLARGAVVALGTNMYSAPTTPLAWTENFAASRETAYAVNAMRLTEKLGNPHRARLDSMVVQALHHLDQMCVAQTATFVQPFMVGLTAEALIGWHDGSSDQRVLPAVKSCADWMWSHTWLASQNTMQYANTNYCTPSGDCVNTGPAPDLNLLIAPLYAWIYRQTGDATYRARADSLFVGGVRDAWLDGAKQFNQNYRWSFAYVTWREAVPLAP